MKTAQGEIKALQAYYEITQKEYDDTHSYYDGIDNKASIFIAISIAMPSILLSAIDIPPGNYGWVCLGFYVSGLLMLVYVLYRIFQALRIRTAKFGAPFDQFREACKVYDNEAIKEAVANTWLEAAKENHRIADRKAEQLRRLHCPLLLEVSFLFAGAVVALAYKL